MGINDNGIIYFQIGTVSKLVGKSVQMIKLWDQWSDTLELEGKERLIPASHRKGKTNARCWTMEEIEQIIKFSKNVKYGDIAEFSRTRWGEKYKSMNYDKSTKTRNEEKKFRNLVNANSKKVQNQRRVDEIKQAKGNMIKTVRKRARQIYDNINYNE